MTYEYAKRTVGEEMRAGDALYDLKESIIPGASAFWMNFADYNLYGDPSVGLLTSDRGACDPATPGVSWAPTVMMA